MGAVVEVSVAAAVEEERGWTATAAVAGAAGVDAVAAAEGVAAVRAAVEANQ